MRWKRLRNKENRFVHRRTSRPDLYPVDRDLPWDGNSFEEGRVFSHLDGTMANTFDYRTDLPELE